MYKTEMSVSAYDVWREGGGGDGEGGQEGGGNGDVGFLHVWRGYVVEETGRVDRKGRQWGCGISTRVEGVRGGGDGEIGQTEGEWGGRISQMECLGGHAFPKQSQVTQLVAHTNMWVILYKLGLLLV